MIAASAVYGAIFIVYAFVLLADHGLFNRPKVKHAARRRIMRLRRRVQRSAAGVKVGVA